ncbi:MAG: class I SAM-dependent methyltransferase [Marinobacter sp.]
MSVLPNSHEALLRNRSYLTGKVALLGVIAPSLLTELATLGSNGLAMTEHAGYAQALEQADSWPVAFGYDAPALTATAFDSVVVFLPKARAELDVRLSLARWLVRPGGRLLVLGEKKEGIAGAVKQLREALPQVHKIDSARHCQVWCAEDVTPLTHFAIADWLDWNQISVAGRELDVAGLPGVFSRGELDSGTSLLLETLASAPLTTLSVRAAPGIPPTRAGKAQRVLDFACGAGVVGAWLQTGESTELSVDAVDVQSQALLCARATYDRAGAQGEIIASDGIAGLDGRWQAVVSNPPFHSGVRTDMTMTERFVRDLASHLEHGGELRLVANNFLPYEALIRRCIGPVERLAENNKFTVYRAFRQ